MAKSAITLASGREMPLVGFGLWKVPKETAAETVYNATDSSTAPTTTKTRKKLAGQGIQRAITEGLVTRAEIFVTTKLWNNYHRREHALRMAKRQSEAWGLGYIDLYLIHFPVALEYIDPAEREYPAWWMDDADKISPANIPISEAWTALEELVDSGIAKSIGVSNFQAQTLYDIKTYARHPISALQIEHHPYLVQGELIQMAQDNGIAVTAYSSFGPLSFVEWPPAFSKEAKGIELLFDAAPVKAA
ncbi:hypothetical protein PENANT_c002G11066 [Penicillium antarcticum]|uniref:D-xylose reductase [NAD(P)H] n=1 Tax=Penicillium antarcticum TaxID=416450 RepID=A0A1V6QLC6_9EURO|nr:hypothetical protein PENANT_c002G11066 [Penicillium antarcticum]